MASSDYIALGALAFSLFAFVISLVTSSKTKKYELTTSHRCELLKWHQEVVEQLVMMRECIKTGEKFNRTASLAKLSALIEQGRFYFPNVIKTGYGAENPSAYQGNRDRALEFLLSFYNIVKEDNKSDFQHLEKLQRLFVSDVFDVLEPREYNKRVERQTSLNLKDGVLPWDSKGARHPSRSKRLKDFLG